MTLSVLLWIVNIPFDLYDTFVIEERFGFNRTTPRTFAADQIKSLALSLLLQSVMLTILFVAFTYFGAWFWLPAWALISVFSLLLVFFYSEWIVPLFNKQTPLEEGELRSAIEGFAQKASFPVYNIYVMDGSKRTTKANAYFTGFGKKKRIVLYDNLIKELNGEEIVAVLAHEIGHYKKKHIACSIVMSLLSTGFMLWLLSLFLENPAIAHALGGTVPSLHLGLAGFAMLYTPLSEVLSLAASCVSRRNEYAADNFTASHKLGGPLISALKKISSKALSNLTPHPMVVFWRYSHPTLLQRMRNIQENF
jgi:STE24 endopeptidase